MFIFIVEIAFEGRHWRYVVKNCINQEDAEARGLAAWREDEDENHAAKQARVAMSYRLEFDDNGACLI